MKKRLGFVSNSSSSSFCILGDVITDEIKTKIFENNKKYIENYFKNNKYLEYSENDNYLETCDEEIENYDFESVFNKLLKDTPLEFVNGIYEFYEDVLIGVSVDNLERNLTIDESEKKIKNLIIKKLNLDENDISISFCTDGGYDD